MYFIRHIVFVVTYLFIIFSLVNNQVNPSHHDAYEMGNTVTTQRTYQNNSSEEMLPSDGHTFVTLIDIVYTDGSKRTCTGSIIHDNVVITAAHCFGNKDDNLILELALSFVVIGTKKMYETGYEQYLPIEKIITHPEFKGWTADLALVYTFAGMTSDKPGEIIPLAGAKSANLNPIDSNVVIITWGHNSDHPKKQKQQNTPCPDSASQENTKSNKIFPAENLNPIESEVVLISWGFNGEHPIKQKQQTTAYPNSASQENSKRSERRFMQEKHYRYQQPQHQKLFQQKMRQQQPHVTSQQNLMKEDPELQFQEATIKQISRYLTSAKYDKQNYKQYIHRHTTDHSMSNARIHVDKDSNKKPMRKPKNSISQNHRYLSLTSQEKKEVSHFRSQYADWRREMGPQNNKLTVKEFGFVNLQACKKLIEKANPPSHQIKDGVVCYSSEDHHISDDDAGSPVIRHGRLVAVTIGGTELDEDHIGVGMRISCFCSWIAQHLPGGGDHLNCCTNCCNI